MAKDGKKIAIGAGIAGLITAIFLLATRKKAAPPPPPPGLANLYGKVTAADTGKAISGVLVALDGMQTYTDSGGNYAFIEIAPGGYVATFSKEGYQPAVY